MAFITFALYLLEIDYYFFCSNCNVGSYGKNNPPVEDLTPSEFTPEMEAVMKRKAEREALEKQVGHVV